MVVFGVYETNPDGTPVLVPDEAILYTAADVTFVIGDKDPQGVGTVFVTTQ